MTSTRDAINAALATVPCDALDVNYCAALRDALRVALPSASLEVHLSDGTELVVEAREDANTTRVVVPLIAAAPSSTTLTE